MKKLLFIALIACFGVQGANAQAKKNIFNHLGVGVSVGVLDGVGLEVATPITDYFSLRAGVSMMPKIKYNADVETDSNSPSIAKEVNVEGKLNKTDFKALVDIHPFKNDFRITGGVYIGNDKLIEAYNTETFLLDPSDWGTAGIKLSDNKTLTSDEQGNVAIDVKVKKVKPYVGIGFGRAVPKKRVAFNFDLGVQFWGEPGVWTNVKDDWGDKSYCQIKSGEVDNEDIDDVLDVASKIIVCPVLSFRLNFRAF